MKLPRVVLCLIVLFGTVWTVGPRLARVLADAPLRIEDTSDAWSLQWTVTPSTLETRAGCVTLNWITEGVREIELNRGGRPGNGEEIYCVRDNNGRDPKLSIHYQDGTRREYIAQIDVQFTLWTEIAAFTALGVSLLAYLLFTPRLVPGFLARFVASDRAFAAFGRWKTVLIMAFLLVNTVVVSNTIRHRATIGYDVADHVKYVFALQFGRLPEPHQTGAFFSPPLPYALPAGLAALARQIPDCNAWLNCDEMVRKAGQLQNGFVAVLLAYFLLRICDRMRPGDGAFKVMALVALLALPVYTRTLSMMRGEPFVALFTVILVERLLAIYDRKPGWQDPLLVGVVMGLLILSRQWGFFVLGGVGLWGLLVSLRERRGLLLGVGLASYLVALVVGGWFYLSLQSRYGSITTFNRAPDEFSAGQPRSFYLGLGDGLLFTEPYEPAFANQLIPVFYADTWGDYWGFFYHTDAFFPDLNAARIAYTGRVNLFALLPTAVLLAGVGVALAGALRYFAGEPTPKRTAQLLLLLVLAVSWAGYMWFLVGYPNPGRGDTIKASYMLHMFPLLAVLAADVLVRWRWLWVLTGLAALYHLPLLFSRYTAL